MVVMMVASLGHWLVVNLVDLMAVQWEHQSADMWAVKMADSMVALLVAYWAASMVAMSVDEKVVSLAVLKAVYLVGL